MKTYKCNFTGREIRAIGVTYQIEDTVQAENEEAARLKLYDKYDMVLDLKIEVVVSVVPKEVKNNQFGCRNCLWNSCECVQGSMYKEKSPNSCKSYTYYD